MAKEPLRVNQLKALLERAEQGESVRMIAKALGLSKSRVHDNIKLAKEKGLTSKNLPDDADAVYARLFSNTVSGSTRSLPDFANVAVEMRNKHVTLTLLHEEYLKQNPDGLRYSQFCERYRRDRQRLDLTMRQTHTAGDKLFLDFAGPTVPVLEVGQAHIFVAVLGASNYTFACATKDETTASWTSGTADALTFFGGVPRALVPDCPKTTVKRPCRYEPVINRSFQDMAEHYRTAVVPARVRKPKDKAKVEGGVLLVQRWILAKLRNRTFMTLAELNDAIKPLLMALNAKPFKKLPGSRQELFEKLDKPQLRPLPPTQYLYATWQSARVANDYHVQLHTGDRRYHLYSVPHHLAYRKLDVRIGARTVELFDRGVLVATHLRSDTPGRTTLDEHMPESHLAYKQVTAKALRDKSARIGPSCREMIDRILADRTHVAQGYRACQGILRMKQIYGGQRLEKACARALLGDLIHVRSVENILKSKLDQLPAEQQLRLIQNAPSHVRGGAYYQKKKGSA